MNGADRTVVAGERVAKAWPGTSGLRPLDFELVAGEVVALRGRSGSGKSTLIALLAGWCAPTGGLLRRSAESDPTSWSGTAVVPQTLGLLPELSIAENVALPARLARRPAADLDGLLGELDLDTLRSRLPAEVSLGQQQRTAVGRALTLPTALLLVDEPTSHQDHGHADLVMRVVRRAADRGAAVLIASHDPIALNAADRTIDLD
ncbi:MAG: ATP-binding cassette domain-containing protein [Ilumatobacter sp.]|nr:ATP-binding cassette domain-containing protein [Ilumatobacter sp.]